MNDDSPYSVEEILKLLNNNVDNDLSDDDDSVIINKEMAQEIIEQIRHISKISKKQAYAVSR